MLLAFENDARIVQLCPLLVYSLNNLLCGFLDICLTQEIESSSYLGN